MILFGLNEKEFAAQYRDVLERSTPEVVSTLRAHLERRVELGVDSAHVEVFVDEYGGAPDIYIYYRGRNNKVDRHDQSLFAGRALNFGFPLNDLANFDERYFLAGEDGDYEFPGLFVAGNTLKAWFSECWKSAGGSSYSVPTTLAVHDGWGDGQLVQLTAAAR
jgi:hypothetical protein